MARKRDYALEYQRRQARARARGFTGYYGERVRGGAGAKPTARAPRGEELARARGHRGFADLLRSIREGDLVGIDPVESSRDKQGRWTRVVVTVLGEDGTEREFTLSRRQLSDARVRALVDRIEAVNAIASPLYPISKLLPESEDELEDAA